MNFYKIFFAKKVHWVLQYWNGIVKFEGEYLNGKKNGKGNEYDSKGNLIYEGEYLNDKRKDKK